MAMATFARQTGAFVIAEGIEDERDCSTSCAAIDDRDAQPRRAIIQGGQGYGIGRPAAELPLAGARLDGHAPRPALA